MRCAGVEVPSARVGGAFLALSEESFMRDLFCMVVRSEGIWEIM